MFKKILLALTLTLMSVVSLAAEFEAGKHYTVLANPIKTSSDTLVVNEFFGYACPHCNSFHPLLSRWEDQLPADVSLVPVPVVFNKQWEMYAKAYYISVELGVYDTTHDAIFNAVHVDKRRLTTKPALKKFFVQQGVSEAEFDQAYDSFALKNAMRLGSRLAAKAKITSVPTLLINGKYVIGAGMVDSHGQMLEVADYLLEKERQAGN